MVKTKCAICNIDNSKELFEANFKLSDFNKKTFSARRIPDRIHFRIVKCKNCGFQMNADLNAALNIAEKFYVRFK